MEEMVLRVESMSEFKGESQKVYAWSSPRLRQ